MNHPISGVLVSGAGGMLILSAAILRWDAIWILVGALLIACGLLWSAETLQSKLSVSASEDRNERQDLPWWLG